VVLFSQEGLVPSVYPYNQLSLVVIQHPSSSGAVENDRGEEGLVTSTYCCRDVFGCYIRGIEGKGLVGWGGIPLVQLYIHFHLIQFSFASSLVVVVQHPR